ncbi:MAG: LytTR family transcriptional regulator DNA-binding domain-containing protein [Lachnospiraceae bacterium]
MIVMVISNESEKERQYIVQYSRDLAGRFTGERWQMIQCSSGRELREVVKEKIPANLACVDITMEGALDMVKELRGAAPKAYIILIASPKISPLRYLRPTVGAESLMLKPLNETQIREVLTEAIRTYADRFYKPDESRMFVVESGGERSLIEYGRICYFEARDKRVYLNTGAEEYGFYGTLDQLEERLEDMFLRCHRSFLVNKEKIESVFLSQNRIVLKERLEVPLSRSYKPAVKEYLRKGEGNAG